MKEMSHWRQWRSLTIRQDGDGLTVDYLFNFMIQVTIKIFFLNFEVPRSQPWNSLRNFSIGAIFFLTPICLPLPVVSCILLYFFCCYSVIACCYCMCVTVLILLFVLSSCLLSVAKGGKLSHNYRNNSRSKLNHDVGLSTVMDVYNTLVIISLFNLVFSSQKLCFTSSVC